MWRALLMLYSWTVGGEMASTCCIAVCLLFVPGVLSIKELLDLLHFLYLSEERGIIITQYKALKRLTLVHFFFIPLSVM